MPPNNKSIEPPLKSPTHSESEMIVEVNQIHQTANHGSSLRAFRDDFVSNRRIYFMAASAAFGGMFFGWDTGLIGGILAMDSFKHSFGLDQEENASRLATLNGNIVSVLQAGCFFGSLSSAYVSERLGRKSSLMLSVTIFIIGSIIQLCSGINSTSLTPLYIGRVIGGWGVGMNSARIDRQLVPAYISESSPQSIRGRTTGMMQLFNALQAGIMLSYFVNYGASIYVKPHLNPAMWRIGFGCQLIPGGLFVLGMLFQDESPRWLCERGRYDEAAKVIGRLRLLSPTDLIVQEQVQDIRNDFEGKPTPTLKEQIFYSFGWGAVPWVLAGELPPNSTRPLSLSLAVATQWLFNFVIAKITPTLIADIKYGTE
ncbi:hypothetical protein Clacol_009057 [Clathrus columnatus]|uniref:Major facilitator superfamily (MFS) profile domain-containing protein n=1 Tax=Clathrus columnatus TaxID=1419009 RepID=A0AAV5AJH9_9AGAM|nr:hypothetical protein Clacol_009057 [Clathrus columnatus]